MVKLFAVNVIAPSVISAAGYERRFDFGIVLPHLTAPAQCSINSDKRRSGTAWVHIAHDVLHVKSDSCLITVAKEQRTLHQQRFGAFAVSNSSNSASHPLVHIYSRPQRLTPTHQQMKPPGHGIRKNRVYSSMPSSTFSATHCSQLVILTHLAPSSSESSVVDVVNP
jgi:hypothetical protein